VHIDSRKLEGTLPTLIVGPVGSRNQAYQAAASIWFEICGGRGPG